MKGIIFGNTQERAIIKLNTIVKDYKAYWDVNPIDIRERKNEYSIIFSNGDIWQAVKFAENQRGRKGNLILLDSEINFKNKMDIAYCCCHDRPYGAIINF